MSAFTVERATALPGPAWLRARRAAAADRIVGAPMPDPDDELWRYTPIKDLDLAAFSTAPPSAEAPENDWVALADRGGLVKIVDGSLVSVELSDATTAAGPFAVLARRLWGTDEDVVILQGTEMGRPCRIEVHAEPGNIRVGGRVAACAEGRFVHLG